jgi:peptidoglycan hydrolase-like protein with peptidoglycan-binding domain
MEMERAQKRLQEERLYAGPIDGKVGSQTQRAIRQYQSKYGLLVTGELDDATQKAMGIK